MPVQSAHGSTVLRPSCSLVPNLLIQMVSNSLNLSGKVNGHLSVTETTARSDFSETVISGNLRLKF